MNKEIIELLENALKEHNDDCLLCALKDTRINSVLVLLKQQPPTSELTKEIRLNVSNWEESILKDTKDIRVVQIIKWLKVVCDRLDRAEAINKIQDKRIANFEAMVKIKDELIFAYESVNAPINPLLSINKNLLELCEEFMEIADDGSAAFDDPVPGSIFLRAKVVISKAKKGI